MRKGPRISGAMDGSLAEQAKFYFNLYDMDKSGNVDPVECYKLLLRSNDRVACGCAGQKSVGADAEFARVGWDGLRLGREDLFR